ncbi:MAG TPA: hypothetical protein VGM82_13590 [Gemmatimonadaceae bacterium]|jgi:hypothetical protein
MTEDTELLKIRVRAAIAVHRKLTADYEWMLAFLEVPGDEQLASRAGGAEDAREPSGGPSLARHIE